MASQILGPRGMFEVRLVLVAGGSEKIGDLRSARQRRVCSVRVVTPASNRFSRG